MRYSKETIKEAKRLLASPARKGDHGFKGAQLTVWKKMQKSNESLLKAILAGRVTSDADEPECPKEYDRYVWVQKPVGVNRVHDPHAECAFGKAKQNPNWSAGTKDGERWANDVSRLRNGLDDDLAKFDYLMSNLKDAQDDLKSAQRTLNNAQRDLDNF